MREVKRDFPWFSITEYEKEAAYLRRRHKPPFQKWHRKPQRWQSLGFLLRYSKYLFHLFAYRHYIICRFRMQYSQIEKIVIYFISCRTQSGNRKGVNRLDLITSFLVSVMAGVVSYYICKWLDRNDSDN